MPTPRIDLIPRRPAACSDATVTLDLHGEGPTITKIHLENKSSIPDIDKAKFDELANKAKVGCPVSKVLKAAEITLDATLA